MTMSGNKCRSVDSRLVAERVAIAALVVASMSAAAQQATESAAGAQPPTPTATQANGNPAAAGAPAANDATAQAPPSEPQPLATLAWLAGCWQGSVNQREFREQWLPLRGGVMVGAGQSVLRGKMLDYQFLRLEPKSEGTFFTQFSGDGSAASFKLDSTVADDKDTIFTFSNTAAAFPARLVYRRGTDGWLYQTIEGVLDGKDRKVIYPLRRIDCETGELILR
jgi:hypothetical protein